MSSGAELIFMATASAAKGGKLRVRTLFLSDIHLGFKRSRVRELGELLASVEAEQIVLVGDIVDMLAMARRFFWAPEHTHIVRTLMARRRAGARVVYIPGNHDASFSMIAELLHGQLEVHREWVYRTRRGACLLVMHGDQMDGTLSCPRWLTRLGDRMYDAGVVLSDSINNLRRRLGMPYWPVAEHLKLSIGPSMRYINQFEMLAARHARQAGYDGVICGHIHRANIRHIEGTLYCNTGDWVESCSALIESTSGELQLLRWPQLVAVPRREAAEPLAEPA
jgi:UDP-2,3-diacylglucosamine pyrophosphatase LpxH